MVNYSIINGTPVQLVNVNAGGTDVDAFSTKDGVALTQSELAALLTSDQVGVVKDQTGSAIKAQTLKVLSISSKVASG